MKQEMKHRVHSEIQKNETEKEKENIVSIVRLKRMKKKKKKKTLC
jgi:hypothetical protein